MALNYTSNLALGQPVTGTESGTWGDDVNNAITAYLDIAIAGTLNLTSANFTAGSLTLVNTQGSSTATNISPNTAQYAILRVSGLTQNSTITAPSTSKTYIVINTDTTFTLTIKASGQAGYVVAPGARAVVAFSGTDYALAATTDITKLSGVLSVLSGGTGVTTSTGSGSNVLSNSPSLVTPNLGVATATTINKVAFTAPAAGSTLTIADGKTLTVNNSITFSGADATAITLPGVNATLAALGVAQSFTATQTFTQVNYIVNTVAVTANAGTVPVTHRLNNFVNTSAAAMTITMATAGAVDGQMAIVRIYDATAVAQTISWVNTEASNIGVPANSLGSTTLPLTVGFQYNGATGKWRCIAST